MSEIVIFGGTTEGRLLTEYCAGNGIRATVCVASEYGYQALLKSPFIHVLTEPMEERRMEEFLCRERPKLVIDATHPYAAVVTKNILAACETANTPYIRVARDAVKPKLTAGSGEIIRVRDVEEAVQFLAGTKGAVLVTTGSKEISAFVGIPDYQERVYARVLPVQEVLSLCSQAGISGKHVIAMQGPFSKEMNAAMLKHVKAEYLVTKEAGTAGGFLEKIEAAMECGVKAVVIGRPRKPEGISLEAGMKLLKDVAFGKNVVSIKEQGHSKRKLSLIGIGMGGGGQLTIEAAERIQESDALLGAPRMLKSVADMARFVPRETIYLGKEVLKWLEKNPSYQRISVIYSGDTGFYSGAATLIEELERAGLDTYYEVEVISGISAVSYLCAKIRVPWEDVYCASAHGRKTDVLELVKCHEKVFLLLGGADSVEKLCRELEEGGYGRTLVSVGERLSYPEERIVTDQASALAEKCFDPLSAVLLRRRKEGIKDER